MGERRAGHFITQLSDVGRLVRWYRSNPLKTNFLASIQAERTKPKKQ